MPDYQKIWNDRYGGSKFLFGKKPNEYFKSKIDTLTPGNLFLPGDGEGRNGVYAALKGWNVESVDFSKIAIERAEEFAKANGVKVKIDFKNLIFDEIDTEKYDVVGISFLHFNGVNKKIVHKKLNKSLKIGGFLILECFSEQQIKLISGGPRKKDSLYNIDEIKEYYHNFNFIELVDSKIELNESDAHKGDAFVVRVFAQKTRMLNEY